MPNDNDTKRYVLVVKTRSRQWIAYGPFDTLDRAEYAAMDYYGTAITGASAKDEFLIAELRVDVPRDGAWT
jgi:hypothetical protein